MMAHHDPFTSPAHLLHDLALGAWLVYSTLAVAAWRELRRWRIVRLP